MAASPFMLFRRSAYEQLGGHRAVAACVAEDLELARLTKAAGLKLSYLLGGQFVSVRMYRSWSALWEGWTKNLYLGAGRNAWLMFLLALTMLLIYPLPWLCLVAIGYKLSAGIANPLDLLAAAVATIAIFFHYDLRHVSLVTLPPCIVFSILFEIVESEPNPVHENLSGITDERIARTKISPIDTTINNSNANNFFVLLIGMVLGSTWFIRCIFYCLVIYDTSG
jgi:hypothetical protein